MVAPSPILFSPYECMPRSYKKNGV
jgi:hypothetical protein